MEFCNLLGQKVDPVAFKQLSLQQAVKPKFRIELIHSDRVFDNLLAGSQLGFCARASNWNHIDVDIRCKALV